VSDPDRALSLLHAMPGKGLHPSVQCVTSAILALSRANRADQVGEWWMMMMIMMMIMILDPS
jgi:hypothetical protein